MGGFRFRSSLKKCRSPVDETKLPDAREKNLWYTQGRVYFTRRQKQENHGEPMVTVNGDLIPNSKEKIYRPKIDRKLKQQYKKISINLVACVAGGIVY